MIEHFRDFLAFYSNLQIVKHVTFLILPLLIVTSIFNFRIKNWKILLIPMITVIIAAVLSSIFYIFYETFNIETNSTSYIYLFFFPILIAYLTMGYIFNIYSSESSKKESKTNQRKTEIRKFTTMLTFIIIIFFLTQYILLPYSLFLPILIGSTITLVASWITTLLFIKIS